MAIKTVKITGCANGRAPSRFFPRAGEFTSSAGIDPDLPVGSERQSSGLIQPAAYQKFSGSNLDSPVVKWITNPKTTKIYAVLKDGRLLSYSSTLGSETLIGTFAGANCGGAEYYNNYLYCFGTGNRLAYNVQTSNFTVGQTLTGATSGATGIITADVDAGASGTLTLKSISGTFVGGEVITDGAGGSAQANGTVTGKTDVSRYGPLDGTPAFQNAWWTGQNLTALTDTAYPQIRLIDLPNHWAYVQPSDNSLFFCDFTGGQGILNRITTVKGTYEGEINSTVNPSAYRVLSLPFGYYPTSLCAYSTNLAVAAIQSVQYDLSQGKASLFVWNPENDDLNFDQQVEFPDPLATALISRYGHLTCFSGTGQGGIRVAEYVGGSTFQELAYIEEGTPPLAGAVETQGKKLYFGSFCLNPVESASVLSIGQRTASNPNGLHNVACYGTQTPSSDQMTTAIRIVSQRNGNESVPQLIAAATSDGVYAAYKNASAWNSNFASVWESPVVSVGSNFRIDRIRVPLGDSVQTGTVITPSIIYDDGVTDEVLSAISQSIDPDAYRVTYKTPQISGSGQSNFRLRFDWTGSTVPTPVAFPVEVTLEVFDDEPLFG